MPPEPLALRLTSNLMVGVTRILSAQYGFHMADVNNVMMKLKKSFNQFQTADIDMLRTDPKYESSLKAHLIEMICY